MRSPSAGGRRGYRLVLVELGRQQAREGHVAEVVVDATGLDEDVGKLGDEAGAAACDLGEALCVLGRLALRLQILPRLVSTPRGDGVDGDAVLVPAVVVEEGHREEGLRDLVFRLVEEDGEDLGAAGPGLVHQALDELAEEEAVDDVRVLQLEDDRLTASDGRDDLDETDQRVVARHAELDRALLAVSGGLLEGTDELLVPVLDPLRLCRELGVQDHLDLAATENVGGERRDQRAIHPDEPLEAVLLIEADDTPDDRLVGRRVEVPQELADECASASAERGLDTNGLGRSLEDLGVRGRKRGDIFLAGDEQWSFLGQTRLLEDLPDVAVRTRRIRRMW